MPRARPAVATLLNLLPLVAVSPLLGCGDDGTPITDAAPDVADTGPLVAPPAPPNLGPCPSGWIESVGDEGQTTCEPWASPPPSACGDDEGIFPGEEGCVRVGSACPAGEFADDLPTGPRIYYVSAAAPTGGDGSLAAPFTRVNDALARAFAGSIVAVGEGTYDGVLRPNAGVTLWGACTAATILTNTMSPEVRGGVVEPRGADTVLRNLRITPVGQSGVVCLRECGVHLEDIVVAGASGVGVGVGFGASLTARSLVVRDTEAGPGGTFGRGFSLDSGSTAEVRRAFFDRNTEIGVACFGSRLVLEDAYIRETRAQPFDDDFGRGLSVEQVGASAEARRIVIERNLDIGIFVNEDAALVAEDVVVRDTLPQTATGISGRGIAVQSRCSLELRRALLERNLEIGLYCGGEAATVDIEDLVVRDTLPRLSDGLGGRALQFELGCGGSVTRGLFVNSRGAAVMAFESPSLVLTDVDVLTVAAEGCNAEVCETDEFGMGIGTYIGSVMRVQRFRISDVALCGVQVAADGELDLMTGLIRDTRIGACVQVPGYDIERLRSEVVYQDNEVNLQTTDLPVPDAFGGT